MTLTIPQIVRSRINDPFRYGTELIIGDGTGSVFQLKQGAPHSTISAGSITAFTAAGGTAWSATGATFDVSAGLVTFSSIPPVNAALQVTYFWSVFSEDEMAYFTGLGGVPEATLGAVNHLLVNYAKRGSWAAPDGSTYNDTQALNSLMALRSALIAEMRGAEVGPVGDSVNWAAEQENYF
jgi:hypothetical protein